MTRRSNTVKKVKSFPSPEKIRQATFDSFASKGYGKTRLSDLADGLGVSLGDLHAQYPSVDAIIGGFLDEIDRAMIDNINPKTSTGKREIYFDMMMARLDAMQEHRAGLVRWLKETAKQPYLWAGVLKRWQKSLSLMLDIAKDSPVYPVKKLGLAGVYLATLKAWSEDESDDMAKTMAALDRALGKAEEFTNTFLTKRKKP